MDDSRHTSGPGNCPAPNAALEIEASLLDVELDLPAG
jgi:hypothetical protein